MSYAVDDDPPIKSHPASKEYLENYDKIDWGDPLASTDKSAGEHTLSPIDPKLAAGLDEIKTRIRCCGTGCVVDPTVDPDTIDTEGDLLKDCPGCRDCAECSTCGAKGEAPCDDDTHDATGQPYER